MKVEDHRRGRDIWFYKIGVGSRDETQSNGWKVKTLSSLVQQFNDTGVRLTNLKLTFSNHFSFHIFRNSRTVFGGVELGH